MPKSEAKKTKFSIIARKVAALLLILAAGGYLLYFFVFNANFREVIPNTIYRSAQPSQDNLENWIDKYGIKTVINLRARKPEDYQQEKLLSEQLGVKFLPVSLSGKRLATGPELLSLIEAIEAAETPVLLHCESVVDRAGMASAIASIAIGNVDFETAKKQAFVPPGPWKRKNFRKDREGYIHDYAHISDNLKLYEDYCTEAGLDAGDWEQFKKWAQQLPPIEDLDIKYESSYSYFPFLTEGKQFFPVIRLIREAYIQFAIQLLLAGLSVYFINRIYKRC